MKIKIIFSVFVLLLVNTVNVFAQEINPCYGDVDPDSGGCPLDTWIIALAIVASLIAVTKLYRGKNSVL
ncbi:hypothetical protein Q3A68_12315 [Mucilaginibacter sp. BT774]|nr:hypothetical protein [Mucilaginibacter sp. BT774]